MSPKFIFAFFFFLFVFASCRQTNEQLLDEAYRLSQQKKYNEAIKIYTEVIRRNKKLQLAYYNRGFAYTATKQYGKALADFDKIMSLQTRGNWIVTRNKDIPYASEEIRDQIPYADALY